jgi:Kef-type K+ transport system membrane component KefB
VPIGLSYTLQGLLDATPVQAFAAGAALCSTSLGTTFTVLASSGLASSRLGVVLTSAAMMDDVVGLVMVQVISNLGGDDFSWVTVVRPVLVSVAFAVIAPLVCLFVVKPLTLRMKAYREANPTARLNTVLQRPQAAFTMHTLILIGLVTGATYAGTSNLFAAYIAGASISWWDSEVPHPTPSTPASTGAIEVEKTKAPTTNTDQRSRTTSTTNNSDDITTATPEREPSQQNAIEHSSINKIDNTGGSAIYEHYYHRAVSKILQPFFFASVGFSIPITRMFRGAIIWRGLVYTALMAFGKLVCGLWLVRLSSIPGIATTSRLLSKLKLPPIPRLWGKSDRPTPTSQAGATPPRRASSTNAANSSPNPPRPFSLHPPLILALAMCARGEIGFLISGVAESRGVFSASGESSDEPSDIFLVVTWAIVLCTIIGPLGVGLSVRRVKKLQAHKNQLQEGAGGDVLGVWGVE